MLNKIMLIGNVGREPEMTYTPTGSAVTKFSLATNRRMRDKTTGEMKEETTWFNIVAWEKLAELCSQYVHKGSKIYVEGRVVIRDYTDKDNVQRRAVDVVISDMKLLDSKGSGPSADDGTGASTGAARGGNAGEVSGGEDFPF
jgi:single-strand DNA-binding protein